MHAAMVALHAKMCINQSYMCVRQSTHNILLHLHDCPLTMKPHQCVSHSLFSRLSYVQVCSAATTYPLNPAVVSLTTPDIAQLLTAVLPLHMLQYAAAAAAADSAAVLKRMVRLYILYHVIKSGYI